MSEELKPVAWAYDVTDRVTGDVTPHVSLGKPDPETYRSNIRPLYTRPPSADYERGLEAKAIERAGVQYAYRLGYPWHSMTDANKRDCIWAARTIVEAALKDQSHD